MDDLSDIGSCQLHIDCVRKDDYQHLVFFRFLQLVFP